MVKKKLTKAFFVSIIIGSLIFSLGLFVGYGFDVLRIKDVSGSLSDTELQTLDYITSKEFLDTFGGDNCDFLNRQLSGISPQLFEIGQKLVSYEERNIFSGDDYKLLKSKYFLLEIRAYVLFSKLNKECDSNLNLILYFYEQNHEDSKRQGYVLDKLVETTENVNIFSFDKDFEIISFLVSRYDIQNAPVIIVNEKTRFDGLTFLGELKEAL
jgi:hypothetical protein